MPLRVEGLLSDGSKLITTGWKSTIEDAVNAANELASKEGGIIVDWHIIKAGIDFKPTEYVDRPQYCITALIALPQKQTPVIWAQAQEVGVTVSAISVIDAQVQTPSA